MRIPLKSPVRLHITENENTTTVKSTYSWTGFDCAVKKNKQQQQEGREGKMCIVQLSSPQEHDPSTSQWLSMQLLTSVHTCHVEEPHHRTQGACIDEHLPDMAPQLLPYIPQGNYNTRTYYFGNLQVCDSFQLHHSLVLPLWSVWWFISLFQETWQ